MCYFARLRKPIRALGRALRGSREERLGLADSCRGVDRAGERECLRQLLIGLVPAAGSDEARGGPEPGFGLLWLRSDLGVQLHGAAKVAARKREPRVDPVGRVNSAIRANLRICREIEFANPTRSRVGGLR
jgi:hypothetical protein